MRFMMLMIPKGYETAPPDVKLDPERVKSMMAYNEALQEAGVLLALDGLHPPSMGARVSFEGGKPLVTDGPFAEAKEVLGGHAAPLSDTSGIPWRFRLPWSRHGLVTRFPQESLTAVERISAMISVFRSRGNM